MNREIKLADKAGQILRRLGKTLSVAESCTGGMLGSWITSVPGSSDYFLGGIIAYHNQVKIKSAGVAESVLRKFGAVSGETALAMARGVRAALGSDIGIGVTGIAGPGGGSAKKPVGLAFTAVASGQRHKELKLKLKGSREEIREEVCGKTLRLLIDFLEKS